MRPQSKTKRNHFLLRSKCSLQAGEPSLGSDPTPCKQATAKTPSSRLATRIFDNHLMLHLLYAALPEVASKKIEEAHEQCSTDSRNTDSAIRYRIASSQASTFFRVLKVAASSSKRRNSAALSRGRGATVLSISSRTATKRQGQAVRSASRKALVALLTSCLLSTTRPPRLCQTFKRDTFF